MVSASKHSYLKKEYRPVVVAVIYNEQNEILLVRSAKNNDSWYLPQGGVDIGERLTDALFREVKEELGIDKKDLFFIGYLGTEDLDAEETRVDRRGFTKGKRYFFFSFFYNNSDVEKIQINSKEISEYLWVSREEMHEALSTTRPEKAELILRWVGM